MNSPIKPKARSQRVELGKRFTRLPQIVLLNIVKAFRYNILVLRHCV